MLSREKFREALTHWGLDLPLTPVTYPSGHVSDNAMYAGEDYGLKATQDETACRLAAVLADALTARGVPAATMLPLPDGRLSLPMGDGLWMTLCRRVKGTRLTSAELIRNPVEGRRIGTALAEFHKASAALDESQADDEPWADHLLGWALPQVQGILPENYLADFAARVEATRALPAALIHRDPNPSNLIDTGDAIGFVDFELSRRFARIFDPCYTMTAVLSETFDRDELPWRENWPTLCRAILAGYEDVSPLTEEEKSAVPTIMQGNELLSIAAFAGSSKYKDVFDVNMRMLPFIIENPPI